MFRSYDYHQNGKFQENLSRPGIIDARGRYRAAARRLRNTVLNCNFSKEQSMLPEDDRMIETCLSVLNCNFNKEQNMLPQDDRMIETCRSVLGVLM